MRRTSCGDPYPHARSWNLHRPRRPRKHTGVSRPSRRFMRYLKQRYIANYWARWLAAGNEISINPVPLRARPVPISRTCSAAHGTPRPSARGCDTALLSDRLSQGLQLAQVASPSDASTQIRARLPGLQFKFDLLHANLIPRGRHGSGRAEWPPPPLRIDTAAASSSSAYAYAHQLLLTSSDTTSPEPFFPESASSAGPLSLALTGRAGSTSAYPGAVRYRPYPRLPTPASWRAASLALKSEPASS
ncbi:hypothetical protein B0H16DRAFT_1713449 [Mycena metata]|uniref:Uncharacterized protein n=1 Tax=Mycena metata TaxID=1033252 RepID=A0AAD7NTA8_9AGAR|nr:hypothetical protein B0H16DRAFT_1713449 [Mycena metata]